MIINLKRQKHNDIATIGRLYIDGAEFCYTLEDPPQDQKIEGKTRIPAGTYNIKIREAGALHARYIRKFSFYKGMLWLQDVPGFKWIYVHVGNTPEDTEGCILVGESNPNGEFIGSSVKAYEKLYKKVYQEAKDGYLTIVVQDEQSELSEQVENPEFEEDPGYGYL